MNEARHQVCVIGGGSWGTALASLLTYNFKQVNLYARNPDIVNDITQNHENSRYLKGAKLASNLHAFSQLCDAIDADLNVLVVVPSHAFANTLSILSTAIDDKGYNPRKLNLIWGTKGLNPENSELLSDIARKQFPHLHQMGIISGPSFAGETVRGLPTALTIGSHSLEQAKQFSYWFDTDNTRLYFNDDIVGVQIGGAVKNVIAIAAGISDGLGFGANARAALITRGLSELMRLGTALGGRKETFMGLTGMGDLLLTCTDNQSRNRRFGYAIGQGKTIAQGKQEIGQEIEGISTAHEVHLLAEKHNIAMPISHKVYAILYQNLAPKEAVKALLNQAPRQESE